MGDRVPKERGEPQTESVKAVDAKPLGRPSAGVVRREFRHELRVSPYPPPNELRAYEKFCPGFAKRLLNDSLVENRHKRTMGKNLQALFSKGRRSSLTIKAMTERAAMAIVVGVVIAAVVVELSEYQADVFIAAIAGVAILAVIPYIAASFTRVMHIATSLAQGLRWFKGKK